MHIILLGAPGTGKGTQAKFIMEKYGIPQISTGDILRVEIQKKSEISKKIKIYMNKGKLVEDKLVIKLVKERIKKKDCKSGFLLDGFPRNINQANEIKKIGIKINYVLEFIVPDSIIIDRIINRRIHIPSGKVYNIRYNFPNNKIDFKYLSTRIDDQKNIIQKRLEEYYKKTAPLVYFYRNEESIGNNYYFAIDGTKKINKINDEISSILKQ